jgi:serine/threonine-protein kinase RsbW
MQTGSITLTIDSRFDNVFLVGSAVNRICRAIALSDQAAYEAEVSVVEAVNNVIEHAYQNEMGHPVEVVVTVEPDRITFQVCDWGKALRWNGERPPPPVVDANDVESLSEGGRGLFLMYALTDHIDYHRANGKNVLTLVKRLPASGPEKDG